MTISRAPGGFLAPWRSLIYRNIDTPLRLLRRLRPLPAHAVQHARLRLPGGPIMGDWMVSIPARIKDPTKSQSAFPAGDVVPASANLDPQPYEEVLPGDSRLRGSGGRCRHPALPVPQHRVSLHVLSRPLQEGHRRPGHRGAGQREPSGHQRHGQARLPEPDRSESAHHAWPVWCRFVPTMSASTTPMFRAPGSRGVRTGKTRSSIPTCRRSSTTRPRPMA